MQIETRPSFEGAQGTDGALQIEPRIPPLAIWAISQGCQVPTLFHSPREHRTERLHELGSLPDGGRVRARNAMTDCGWMDGWMELLRKPSEASVAVRGPMLKYIRGE